MLTSFGPVGSGGDVAATEEAAATNDFRLGHFAVLPTELVLRILSFVPSHTLLTSTCRLSSVFRELALDPTAWRARYQCYFPLPSPSSQTLPQDGRALQERVLQEELLREKIICDTQKMSAQLELYPPMGTPTPIEKLSEWAQLYPCSQKLQIVHVDALESSSLILTPLCKAWGHLREFRLCAPPETLATINGDQLEAFFKKHPGLERVQLSGLKGIGEDTLIKVLGHCKGLRELEINHENLTDRFLTFLSGFQLSVLKITGEHQFTGNGLHTLTKGFADLVDCEFQIYNMTWNESDWIPFLENHPKIRVLTLCPKEVQAANDAVLQKIAAKLQHLQILYLYGCSHVTSEGLQALRLCPSLQMLHLDGCSKEVEQISKQEPFTSFSNRLSYCEIKPIEV